MRNGNNEHKYDDIIGLPHHVSKTRPRMTMIDRAAQFSPFAALTGYEAAIDETARLTDAFVELDESQKEVLDKQIQQLKLELPQKRAVTVTYFKPDERKCGGTYVTITGIVKKIDEYERLIKMADGSEIPIVLIKEITPD